MNYYITASEVQMLGCFGVEPRLLDSDAPWCYNEAVYMVEVDGLSISFTIVVAEREIHLVVQRGHRRLYELDAVSVDDVRVIDEPGRDALEFILDERSWLRLQLRPHFEITQGFGRVVS